MKNINTNNNFIKSLKSDVKPVRLSFEEMTDGEKIEFEESTLDMLYGQNKEEDLEVEGQTN